LTKAGCQANRWLSSSGFFCFTAYLQ
jgi:hypothetical protein